MKIGWHLIYWLAIGAALLFGSLYCNNKPAPCPPSTSDTVYVDSHGSVIDQDPGPVKTIAAADKKRHKEVAVPVDPDAVAPPHYFLDDFELPADETADDSLREYSNVLKNDTISITSSSIVQGKLLWNEIKYDLKMPVIYKTTTNVVPRKFLVFGSVSTTLQSDLYVGGGVLWKRAVFQYGYGGTDRHLISAGIRIW